MNRQEPTRYYVIRTAPADPGRMLWHRPSFYRRDGTMSAEINHSVCFSGKKGEHLAGETCRKLNLLNWQGEHWEIKEL